MLVLMAIIAGGGAAMLLAVFWLLKDDARPPTRMHDGLCEIDGCERDFIIMLDGRECLCWDHYSERMKAIREATTPTGDGDTGPDRLQR